MADQKPNRREFPAFPFDPYPIQIDFMNALYDSLDRGGVVMLESPTGTGKTLSIICSALQWLVDQRRKPKPESRSGGGGGREEEEPDWMRDFVVETEERRAPSSRRAGFNLRWRKRETRGPRRSKCGDLGNGEVDEEVEFLVEEYESGEEVVGGGKRKDWTSSEEEGVGEDEMEEEVVPKVFFCSRTHSQLSQFVKEFKRTSFTSEVNLVCLGSRKNLCINTEVLKLGNSNRINERCLELQKNKSSKELKTTVSSDGAKRQNTKGFPGCPMLRKQTLQKQFKDEARPEAMDIEDLVHLGNKMGTCPYYGSRNMVPTSELVVLPYQSLLLKSARESLALNLKNSVVIIDEAHNLADSLTSMYNAKITLSQLEQVRSHLQCYLDRFFNCLGPGNRRYIQTLMSLSQSFLRMLLEDKGNTAAVMDYNAGNASDEKYFLVSMTINEFLFAIDIDNINLVKLQQYIKESNIVHKVSGYGVKLAGQERCSVQNDGLSHSSEGAAVSDFQAFAGILLSLTNDNPEGRIIISRRHFGCSGRTEERFLKFIMLSGEKIFSQILDETHAVVLAGGTLQPIEETRMRLFPGLSADQIHFFSCNHIVPPESILPIVISRGPSGATFDFSYNSRSASLMIEELGRLLCNLVTVVPEGIVAFFSSFDYEGKVYETWKASGILDRILKKKRIFREPRNSMDVETILAEYKETILSCTKNSKDEAQPHGALLLAVVGGKVSEGINFSDGMGRCVVMVGLPYPNPSDIELMERIKHIESLEKSISPNPHYPLNGAPSSENASHSGFNILRSCKHRGREYYDNLCMKAVNQSIGRAIRHINDYAAILLVDSRYASDFSKSNFSCPKQKLPLWIKDRLVSSIESYGQVHRSLHQFFQFNRQRYHN